jgi:hypothetical protein
MEPSVKAQSYSYHREETLFREWAKGMIFLANWVLGIVCYEVYGFYR